MKSNQKTLLALLVVAAAMSYASADLLLDITTYLWRWFVYFNAMGGLMGCWMVGGWGLLFDDDDGKMIDTCYSIWGGQAVTFEDIEYSLD
mmetsp:Transcript_34385/g.52668  ORF Transcript_34385/g.52668 Transcript_34385/m.52668 type:complete len:90 (+) Transcript_34385:30-299(+)